MTITITRTTLTSVECADFIQKLGALKPGYFLQRTNSGYQVVTKDSPQKLSLDQIREIAATCFDTIRSDYKRDLEFVEKDSKESVDKAFVGEAYHQKMRDLHNNLAGYAVRFIDDTSEELAFLRVSRFLVDLQHTLYRRPVSEDIKAAEADTKTAVAASKGPAPTTPPPPTVPKKELIPLEFSCKELDDYDYRVRILNIFLNHSKVVNAYLCKVSEIYKSSRIPLFAIETNGKRILKEDEDEANLYVASEVERFCTQPVITNISQAIFSRMPNIDWLDDLTKEFTKAQNAFKDIQTMEDNWYKHFLMYRDTKYALRELYGKVLDFSPIKPIDELEGSPAARGLRTLFLDLEQFQETRPNRDHPVILWAMNKFLAAASLDMDEETLKSKEILGKMHQDVMNQCEALPKFDDNVDTHLRKYVLVPIGYSEPVKTGVTSGHTAFVVIERDNPETYSFTVVNTGVGAKLDDKNEILTPEYCFLTLAQISDCLLELYQFHIPSKNHSMMLVNQTINRHFRKWLGYNVFNKQLFVMQGKGTCSFIAPLAVLKLKMPITLFRYFLSFMVNRTIRVTEEALEKLGKRRIEFVQAILKKETPNEAEEIIDTLFEEARKLEILFKENFLERTQKEAFPAASTTTQKQIDKTLKHFEMRHIG